MWQINRGISSHFILCYYFSFLLPVCVCRVRSFSQQYSGRSRSARMNEWKIYMQYQDVLQRKTVLSNEKSACMNCVQLYLPSSPSLSLALIPSLISVFLSISYSLIYCSYTHNFTLNLVRFYVNNIHWRSFRHKKDTTEIEMEKATMVKTVVWVAIVT